MELAIKSTDIDVSKLNIEAFQLIKSQFPDEADQDIAR